MPSATIPTYNTKPAGEEIRETVLFMIATEIYSSFCDIPWPWKGHTDGLFMTERSTFN